MDSERAKILGEKYRSPSPKFGTLNKRRSRILDIQDETPKCFLCCGEANHICNWCRNASYCSPDHYRFHRFKSKCWPFAVDFNPDKGRILKATKLIRRGDIILIDDAVVMAPNLNSTPVCPSCLQKVTQDQAKPCPRCSLPMCGSDQCFQNPVHAPECSVLSFNKGTSP